MSTAILMLLMFLSGSMATAAVIKMAWGIPGWRWDFFTSTVMLALACVLAYVRA